ncbi:hypothetical protein IV203_004290 [Nitzschia inconspicua]|uniref:Uncharacterized protein n=1 Tax=Nitzschia inconspicua TaxID=303405 RepID=A0A9K3L3G5_9STRA|nr:hypothetical protein IV203_004290 [Nitzschia inconspicua]
MRLFASFCRGDDRHRNAVYPPNAIGPKQRPPSDEKSTCRNRKSLHRLSNSSPTTVASDSMFTSNTSLGETGSIMLDSPGLRNLTGHSQNIGQSESHPDPQDLAQLAQVHFHRGCELWAQNDFAHAMEELEMSKSLWKRQHPHLLILLQHPLQHNSSARTRPTEVARKKRSVDVKQSNNINEVEAVAQLYYAMGMVQLAMTNPKEALVDFRRSLQVTILGLGRDHNYLVDATAYMMRTSLLTMGYASPKISTHMRLFVDEVHKEKNADRLWKHGRTEDLLNRYACLELLHDTDVQTQARVMTKVATLHEEWGDFVIAGELWSDILGLFLENGSIGADHPLTKEATDKGAAIQVTLERTEI